tara:strand:+ start:1211 stop:1654 length:444 start_codon:yes stop_codon:yes gene_type:complete
MKFIKKNYIVQIMDINLPYGSGLSICNPRSISLISNKGYEVIDGGTAKCRKLDSEFYDLLVSMGHRGRSLSQNIQADWIISINKENNNFIFSYVNPSVGSVDFLTNDGNFNVSGRNIMGVRIENGINYKVKVGPSASKNIMYLLNNH